MRLADLRVLGIGEEPLGVIGTLRVTLEQDVKSVQSGSKDGSEAP